MIKFNKLNFKYCLKTSYELKNINIERANKKTNQMKRISSYNESIFKIKFFRNKIILDFFFYNNLISFIQNAF
jgi:hypothetical protein